MQVTKRNETKGDEMGGAGSTHGVDGKHITASERQTSREGNS
jgi:hypothetical protein